jgi:MerR family transcriptional regulator/heat shock protein HspR
VPGRWRPGGDEFLTMAEQFSRMKIGAVARHFNISVDLLRLYEREGLLIPLKSPKGTRYFTEQDLPWIETLLSLVRESRLNFAGIRHLLALLPCWDISNCPEERKAKCLVPNEASEPCWMQKGCSEAQDCYACPVYRSAVSCRNLKVLLAEHAHQNDAKMVEVGKR